MYIGLHVKYVLSTSNSEKKHIYRKMVSPWGPPSSPVLSEIYLQFIENTKIYDILRHSKVEGYFRYVDDILLVYIDNLTNIEEILSLFNNITPGLTFTLEQEQDTSTSSEAYSTSIKNYLPNTILSFDFNMTDIYTGTNCKHSWHPNM